MAQIMEGSTALYIGVKSECEELAATMQQAGINNLNVEEL